MIHTPCLLSLLLCAATPALQSADNSESGDQDAAPGSESFSEDRSSVTEHSLRIGERDVAYVATAGTLTLKEEDGTAKASIFYVAYTRSGSETAAAARPLTFSFNGGPGSSSVWLHLGLFGPKRVAMPEGALPPAPPFRLIDNGHSLLDLTDLVFIDPVTTGYSRAVPGEDDTQYHGFEPDIESVAEFIRLYTTRNGRWGSPKFLAGESYGTTRAAGLARELQGRHGIELNGIVLVSSILNFQTARFDPGNDLPYVLFLPTYTATAWFHRRLAPELAADLRAALDAAQAFALGEYSRALLLGNRLPQADRERVAKELARYTGLSREYVLQNNLRVPISRFVKQLLRDERLTLGRLDSRFKGQDRDAAGERYEYDPSYAAIQGAYSACLNDYLRRDLGFESDLPYEILTGRVRPWSYEEFENRYLDVSEHLRAAMARNPHLKVFVANGYYDLATPYFATEHTFGHFSHDPDLVQRVSMGHYQAGHMMYIHGPSLVALERDLRAFFADCL